MSYAVFRMRQTVLWATCGMALLATVIAAGQAPRDMAQFDPAAVERGQKLLVAECGFCHGSTARGGSSGPDLTRSELVANDENGTQLGDFLRVGRPDRGMPKFDLTNAQVSDLATYLHSTIYQAASRRTYKILDVLVGDAKAGEAFFYGAGKCGTCHSTQLDLRGVGAKYEPVALQQRMLMPRGALPGPPYTDPNAIKVTVSPPTGESAHGALVRLTDFEVTLYDAQGRMQSWLRNGDVPRVVVTDPLQGHMDMLPRWTDTDMHNVTAYLATLK
jgi:cytochrome c oxidase cbb3-type subunit III